MKKTFLIRAAITAGTTLAAAQIAYAAQHGTNTANTTTPPKSLEFSADAVQALPGQEIQTGKLYVGKLGTRFEFQKRGRPIVQIMLPEQGLMRILFPLERRYIEFKRKPGTLMSPARPDTPCTSAKHIQCEKLSATKINGMPAERWRIRAAMPPRELRIWWDAKRKIALRKEFSDGRIMQATLRGMQKFEDRDVEAWEFIYTSPNGRFTRTMSLIAPDLGIAVIEQQPNGVMRRLHNVTKGAPAAKLFQIPAGYKKIDPPRPKIMPLPPANRGGAGAMPDGRPRAGRRPMTGMNAMPGMRRMPNSGPMPGMQPMPGMPPLPPNRQPSAAPTGPQTAKPLTPRSMALQPGQTNPGRGG